LFSILGDKVPAAYFLDLFAGTGAVALEALSRGAQKAVAVDILPSLIYKNTENLNFQQKIKIFKKDVFKSLSYFERQKDKFDIIFLDPPYKFEFIESCIRRITDADILVNNGLLVVEHYKFKSLQETYNNFSLIQSKKYGETVLSFYERKAL